VRLRMSRFLFGNTTAVPPRSAGVHRRRAGGNVAALRYASVNGAGGARPALNGREMNVGAEATDATTEEELNTGALTGTSETHAPRA